MREVHRAPEDKPRQARTRPGPLPSSRRSPAGFSAADTSPAGISPADALALQRSIGNSAVNGLVAAHQHGAGGDHEQEQQDQAPSVQRSTVHEALSGAGLPLAEPLRQEMEARLGADFSDVRLHSSATAQRSAAEIGARAYTSGDHIVIGDGGTDKRTLAHELTHVIQQRHGPVAGTDNGTGVRVSDPSDRFEREAEANAARVMAGSAPVQRAVESHDGEHGHLSSDAARVEGEE